ncbi:DUF2169 domain-containing protein [Sorangium sp. So ce375]|uniref:DUF2169 family type VI secretion system accessory protein n=1 Tax=Sorangium sp. So ce375 TaxID=3133306 RepID=UPI003F5B10E1
MKVCKPLKIPILTRVVEHLRRPQFHVAAIIGFPLDRPRALLDELAFWSAVTPDLGMAVLDEGISKARGELLVAGRCCTPGGRPLTASYVRAKVGAIDKKLMVMGDRHRQFGFATEPKPFAEMPIDWAHAYGGKDYPRNPYGIGAEDIERDGKRVRPLPNIEPFGGLLGSNSDQPESFAPMDMSFAPRRARAGTFGRDYVEKYAPGLPPDHDPTVYNAAPEDQWIPGFWRGDERFLVENMNPASPRIEGDLPGLVARAFVTHRTADGERFVEIGLRCDTVWLFPTSKIGALILHGWMLVADDDARDIVHLVVACEEPAAPRPVEHYQQALVRRLDKDKGSLNDLSDSDLMPARASGVVANMDLGPIGQWLKPGLIAMQNERRGAERRRQERVAQFEAQGLDPALHGLAEPLPAVELPPTDDLDAMAEYLLTIEAQVAEEEEKAKKASDKLREEQRAAMGAAGFDPAAEPAEITGGPPTFRAEAHLRQQAELASIARTAGEPDLELEAKLASPAFHEELLRLEELTRTGYQQTAHLAPAAPPMTEEAVQLARALVQVARDAGEPLADRDLTGADFRGMDLTGMDFSRAFLEGADLRDADLSGANLEGAVLTRANLRGASLKGTRLVGANLGAASLERASFEGADLSQAVLMGARVEGASFARATLTGADVLETRWTGVDLAGARLDKCTFLRADFTGSSVAAAHLVQTTFIECQLDRVDFSGADLQRACFVTCKGEDARFVRARMSEAVIAHKSELPRADFTDAVMEKCCLRTTVLRGAKFVAAKMVMSDLSECDASAATFDRALLNSALLIRARLDGASLRGVNLTEAILSKSRLAGADFTGAQLTRADFSRAIGDRDTRFTEAVVKFTRFDQGGTRPTT